MLFFMDDLIKMLTITAGQVRTIAIVRRARTAG